MGCADCLLKGSTILPYQGSTNAEIVFVGESPGYEEEKSRIAFTGESGKLLKRKIKKARITKNSYCFTNAAKCRINKKKFNKKQIDNILKECRPNLVKAIHLIKPKIIVTLGAIALQQIQNEKTVAITKEIGNWVFNEEFNCYVLANWHPAAILYTPGKDGEFDGVMNQLRNFQKNDYVKEEKVLSWKIVDSIRPLLDGGLPKDETGAYVTALDTETQGVEWYKPDSVIISYSIAASHSEGWQIFLQEEVPTGEGNFDITVCRGGTKKDPKYCTVGIKKDSLFDQKVAELEELLLREDIKKYFMNMKFEKHRFYNLELREIKGVTFDCAIGAHVLNSETFTNASLDTLIKQFSPVINSHKDDITKAEKADMLLLTRTDRDRMSKYACDDATQTLLVGQKVRKLLLKDPLSANYYVNMAHKIETVFLFEVERNGFHVDQDAFPIVEKEIKEEAEKEIITFKKYCPQIVQDRHPGILFRLTRQIILKEALYKFTNYSAKGEEQCNFGFGITPTKFSEKTKNASVDKEALEILLKKPGLPRSARLLIETYQKWGVYNTIGSRYLNNIKKYVHDGKAYPSYSITFTSSGRTGARNPAVQTFPKRGKAAKLLRKLIIAPPGKKLMELDHATLELRTIAHVANDKLYLQMFKDKKDPHLLTGLSYSKKRLEDMTKDEIKSVRQSSKAINFGLPYNISPAGLAIYAKTYGVEMSIGMAEKRHRQYFLDHPDIKLWHDKIKRQLKTVGYLRGIWGRKRILQGAKSSKQSEKAKAFRVGTNFLIQGPSSDLTLLGGYNLITSEEYQNTDGIEVVVFLHDAIYLLVDEDKVAQAKRLCANAMEHVDTSQFGFKFNVNFIADTECGNNLAEMEEI